MYLVTRDGKPLLYDTFDREQMGNKALWESHEVTLFKRKEQGRPLKKQRTMKVEFCRGPKLSTS